MPKPTPKDIKPPKPMARDEYLKILQRQDLTFKNVADFTGLAIRQAQRYAAENAKSTSEIPGPVAKLLRLLDTGKIDLQA